MDNKVLKAVFVNGSPRKKWNTAQMLESAMKGAQEAGAEVELINLYDIDFKGCKSCFACKIKNSKTNGVCALKDDLRPVLERCRQDKHLLCFGALHRSIPLDARPRRAHRLSVHCCRSCHGGGLLVSGEVRKVEAITCL